MITLSAKIRKIEGKKTKTLRKKGVLPAVIYGPGIKTLPLEIGAKEFEKVYSVAGESSLILLDIEKKQKTQVLIHDIQKNPLSSAIIHIDFYQVPLTREIEAKVPLVFEGVSPAVKELEGTLVENMREVEVKAFAQNLTKEIKVDIGALKTFQDHILIKDLKVPPDVKILKEPDEIVASVTPPQKIEEELEKPIEEKVEEVEKVETKKKEQVEEATT